MPPRTVETLLSLEQTRSSLRVEWYIAALIIAEPKSPAGGDVASRLMRKDVGVDMCHSG
jgi:hypothetical protein